MSMNETNVEGYDLIVKNDGQWNFIIKGKNKSTTGNYVAMLTALVDMGFDPNEIVEGLEAADQMGHNAVHFGYYKRFIYTFNSEKEAKEIA